MMRALTEGSIEIPGKWILGFRPKMHMSQNPAYHMQVAHKVREFYEKYDFEVYDIKRENSLDRFYMRRDF